MDFSSLFSSTPAPPKSTTRSPKTPKLQNPKPVAKYFSESLVCRVLSNVEEKRAAVKQEAHKEQQSEDTAVTSFQSRSVRELLILPRRRCFLSLATFVEVHGSFFQLSVQQLTAQPSIFPIV